MKYNIALTDFLFNIAMWISVVVILYDVMLCDVDIKQKQKETLTKKKNILNIQPHHKF